MRVSLVITLLMLSTVALADFPDHAEGEKNVEVEVAEHVHHKPKFKKCPPVSKRTLFLRRDCSPKGTRIIIICNIKIAPVILNVKVILRCKSRPSTKQAQKIVKCSKKRLMRCRCVDNPLKRACIIGAVKSCARGNEIEPTS